MGVTDGAQRPECGMRIADCGLKMPQQRAPIPKSEIRNPQSGDFVLTLRPVPRGRDRYGRSPLYRMKGLLKTMRRRFGWKCVSLRPKWMEEEMEQRK